MSHILHVFDNNGGKNAYVKEAAVYKASRYVNVVVRDSRILQLDDLRDQYRSFVFTKTNEYRLMMLLGWMAIATFLTYMIENPLVVVSLCVSGFITFGLCLYCIFGVTRSVCLIVVQEEGAFKTADFLKLLHEHGFPPFKIHFHNGVLFNPGPPPSVYSFKQGQFMSYSQKVEQPAPTNIDQQIIDRLIASRLVEEETFKLGLGPLKNVHGQTINQCPTPNFAAN